MCPCAPFYLQSCVLSPHISSLFLIADHCSLVRFVRTAASCQTTNGGCSDRPHFTYCGHAVDVRTENLKAFQRLYNNNRPLGALALTEDGIYGPATAAALASAPCNGWPTKPPPPPDTVTCFGGMCDDGSTGTTGPTPGTEAWPPTPSPPPAPAPVSYQSTAYDQTAAKMQITALASVGFSVTFDDPSLCQPYGSNEGKPCTFPANSSVQMSTIVATAAVPPIGRGAPLVYNARLTSVVESDDTGAEIAVLVTGDALALSVADAAEVTIGDSLCVTFAAGQQSGMPYSTV